MVVQDNNARIQEFILWIQQQDRNDQLELDKLFHFIRILFRDLNSYVVIYLSGQSNCITVQDTASGNYPILVFDSILMALKCTSYLHGSLDSAFNSWFISNIIYFLSTFNTKHETMRILEILHLFIKSLILRPPEDGWQILIQDLLSLLSNVNSEFQKADSKVLIHLTIINSNLQLNIENSPVNQMFPFWIFNLWSLILSMNETSPSLFSHYCCQYSSELSVMLAWKFIYFDEYSNVSTTSLNNPISNHESAININTASDELPGIGKLNHPCLRLLLQILTFPHTNLENLHIIQNCIRHVIIGISEHFIRIKKGRLAIYKSMYELHGLFGDILCEASKFLIDSIESGTSKFTTWIPKRELQLLFQLNIKEIKHQNLHLAILQLQCESDFNQAKDIHAIIDSIEFIIMLGSQSYENNNASDVAELQEYTNTDYLPNKVALSQKQLVRVIENCKLVLQSDSLVDHFSVLKFEYVKEQLDGLVEMFMNVLDPISRRLFAIRLTIFSTITVPEDLYAKFLKAIFDGIPARLMDLDKNGVLLLSQNIFTLIPIISTDTHHSFHSTLMYSLKCYLYSIILPSHSFSENDLSTCTSSWKDAISKVKNLRLGTHLNQSQFHSLLQCVSEPCFSHHLPELGDTLLQIMLKDVRLMSWPYVPYLCSLSNINMLPDLLASMSSSEISVDMCRFIGYFGCMLSNSCRIQLARTPFASSITYTCDLCDLEENGNSKLNLDDVWLAWKRLWKLSMNNSTYICELMNSFEGLLKHINSTSSINIFEAITSFITHPVDCVRERAFYCIVIVLQYEPPSNMVETWNSIKHNLQLDAEKGTEIIETTIITIGKIMDHYLLTNRVIFYDCLEILLEYAQSTSPTTKCFAFEQLFQFKSTDLIQHLEQLSLWAINQFTSDGKIFQTLGQILDVSTANLIENTFQYSLPHLIMNESTDIVRLLVMKGRKNEENEKVEGKVITKLLQYSGYIISHLLVKKPGDSLTYFLGFFTKSGMDIVSVMRSSQLQLIYNLIVELGNETTSIRDQALQGLLFVASTLADKTITLIEIPQFLLHYCLGIFSKMHRSINASDIMTCQRVKIVRGLQALVTLIQQPISSLCPQVIGLLQLFLQNDELWDAALEAWGGFTRVIDEQALNQQFIQVAVTLLEIEPKCNDIQRTTMIGIFEYLVFEHIDHIDSIYLKLIQVPDTAEWNHLRMALQSKVEGISPLDQLKHLVDQLRHENASVILYSLKKIDRILLNNELAFQMNLLDDTSDPIFKHLIQNLFTICTKYHHLNNEITSICCKCIGTLGAPDPSRVNVQFHSNETYGADLDLSTFGGILRFACLMIQNHFVPIFQATQDSNTQNVLAYSIQEVLGCVGFTSNIVENAQSLQNSKPKDKSDNSALLARYWLQLSKLTTNVIQPLVGAKYQVSAIENKPLNYPIYPKSKGFRVWLQSFVLDLIPKIGNPNVRNIFTACKHIISYGDMNLTQIYLPHIFVNVIISDNSIHYDDILKEFIAILSDSNAEEQHQLCLQTIFNLVDHLYQFIRHYRVKISKIKIRNTASSGQSLLTQFQFELGRVERLVNDIPQSLMAEASIRCQAYARALLHFEQHIRSEMRYKSNEEMQLMYGQLQKIYAHLEDSDAIEGLIIKLNNPTLEQQIIQHEVGGRWTAAQSCYEVLLQQSPEETAYQFGMLNCLQNMGHYESLITYASGIMERHPSKIADTIPFTIAASWRLGEWKQLKEYLGRDSKYSFESALGKLLLSIYEKNDLQFDQILLETREKLNSSIAAASMESYKRSYDTVLQLSMLSEIEQFYSKIVKKPMCSKADISKVMELWQARLNSTVSSFKVREPILNLRRILLSIKTEFTTEVEGELIHSLTEQKGKLWIQSAKESRKSEYFQTSFSSILQALEMSKNLAKVEHAKYLWARNEHYQAMLELKALLKCDFRNIKTIASTSSEIHLVELNELQISKAKLKLAAWLESTNGLHSSNIIAAYIQINRETPNWEKGNFYLGRFYNRFYEKEKQPSTESSNQVYTNPSSYNIPNLSYLIVKQYGKSLLYGTKYLYQSLPRMLTVWLDLGMSLYPVKKTSEWTKRVEEEKTVEKLTQTNAVMRKFVSRLPAYQFLTAMPQLISRICHPNPEVQEILESIIVSVLCVYPQQTLWHLMAVAKSTVKSRVRRIASIFSKVKSDPTFRQLDPQLVSKIQYAEAFVDQLLNLCNFPSGKDVSMLSMSRDFRKLQKMAALGNGMIVPLQSSLTVTLPTGSYSASSHKPFANDLPRIIGFKDEIEIVTSLQRPKKITMIGSNGHNYIFLCKPEDDLRKDSRLMEFNSIVNRLLKKDSEGRKRKLHIRTYAVVPLNEKCGLIQWVLGTSGFRNILIKYYKSRGIYTSHQVIKEALAKTSPSKVEIFTNVILPKHPPIFQNWFLESFPEPTKWLASRSAYTSTTATMSMVGYVVGLGDRHGENILFDELTGECLHVDLNCLFEKGLEFEIPERVPFRLTHNMVDAFGISGIEGSFRKSCEVSLRVLRANRELLMSVLETFLHDPLCEWSKSKNHKNEETEVQNPKAIKSLAVIDRKLQGCIVTARLPLSVEGQVDELICQATNPENLCQMYIGWAPYL